MNNKKSKDKKYQLQETSSVANDSQTDYATKSTVDLFSESGERQYYTVDEYFSILKAEINKRFDCEAVKDEIDK